MTTLLILSIFVIFTLLMMLRKIPAVVALPLMGLAFALAAGVSLEKINNQVFGEGIFLLSEAIFPVFLAAILGQIIAKSRIAESIVKLAAELGGDNPFTITVLCFLAILFCFIGLMGTGALIMVGIIVLPIMMSVGVPPRLASAVLLFGYFLGYQLNIARWQVVAELVHVPLLTVGKFAMVFLVPGVIVTILMILFGLKYEKRRVYAWSMPRDKTATERRGGSPLVRWYAMISPIVPLACVLLFKMHIITALIVGILYTILSTQWQVKFRGVWNLLHQSIFEGFRDSALTVALMFGVGILVTAATLPELSAPINALLQWVEPKNVWGFLLLFGIVGTPLGMYRGPMNPWGLGGAIARLMSKGELSSGALAGAFWTMDFVVGVADPTDSQIVWVSGYVNESPVRIVQFLLPYAWLLGLIGTVLTIFMFPLFD
ncbi:MAG: hypothetical protein ACOYEF_06520 [Planifilum sp.]|jgi:H+/gluconate symporter-like permease